MNGISITPDDVLKARKSNFLDDMDTTYSKRDGRIVTVAMKDGVHVCWGCGEPFDEEEKDERSHEKFVGEVPVLLHRKCLDPKKLQQYSLPSVAEVSKGLSLRRMVAKVTKPFLGK